MTLESNQNKNASTLTRIPAKKANKRMSELPQWSITSGTITREFVFGDFRQAVIFVDRVAEEADAENHHPDIQIHYNKVRLDLSTHKVGGLSEKDFHLAAKINQLHQ